MTDLPPDAPRPRRCLIRKRTPECEYGFNLHAEKSKGQFVGAVDSGSPADAAGLRPGDRIVAVNGVFVANEPHKQLVTKIKENAMFCDLIVVDEDTQTWYNDRQLQIPVDPEFAQVVSNEPNDQVSGSVESSPEHTPQYRTERISEYRESSTPRPPSYQEAMAKTPAATPLRPRLCKLLKPDESAEFGFNLHAEKNSGHFIGKVDVDSIGEHAGLEQGQRIVGVNGVLLYPHTPHKDVVSLIKGNPLRSELLVASPEVDAWYKNNGLEYDFANAEQPAPVEAIDGLIVSKGVADITISNGSSVNGDSGIVNGGKAEEMAEKEESVHEPAQPQEPPRFKPDNSNDSVPQTSVEPYESIVDNPPPRQPAQPEWMQLSAAQLRERVGQHKKADPRTQPLSLQQKHDLIRNM